MTSSAPPIEELVELYAEPVAHLLYDEAVTELQHALQCAALASEAGEGPELVAAALLHDVGHLLLDDNVALDEKLATDFVHEKIGARHLARWFGPTVTGPVALHVAAKRYLCSTDPGYHATLSPSSVRSLALQGGAMTTTDVAAFEANPACGGAVLVRRWDDLAKVADLDVPAFDHYEGLLRRVSMGATEPRSNGPA